MSEEKTFDLFSSYLANRTQNIAYDNDKRSEGLTITRGIPQGLTLLCLIYANDLLSASILLKLTTFADDTNLFYSQKDLKILFNTANKELDHIRNWFNVNKLSLNTDKR